MTFFFCDWFSFIQEAMIYKNLINDIKFQHVYYTKELIHLANVYHIIFFIISRNKFKMQDKFSCVITQFLG